MSETRRQLFKVSILSAFGLAACSSTERKAAEIGPGASDPQFIGMMVDTSGGWIYLEPHFNWLDKLDYYIPYKFKPSGDELADFDLGTVAGSLTVNDIVQSGNLQITGTDSYLNIVNGQVSLPPKLTQLTWNEVGSKKHRS
jgi:hypothetical protein